ncbi:inversin-like isoform X6 [Dermacentor albipictus]|uniref:inversin-like isoform X6 n=1 Tax=Dermacentor albipictus TaxID=60249 RepID=UPI0038FC4228
MGTRGNDQSVLHLCALRGDWSDIQPGLLESGALEVQDRLGRTPLFLCVMLGDSQGAQLLLRAGARSDHGDHAGQTPLHLAARKGHRSLVRLLLAAGAPWARGDVHGCTPLHCVAAAAASWPAQLARSILGMVLDCMDVSQVDLQDKLKQTALHKSALACHLENMLALLKKGANALMQDVDGRTALHLCAASSQLAALGCTSLLLDAEPPLISWQDYQGCTPLHLAVASGTLAVIDLLTQRSSGEVNALDDLFRTPLHWAAILGRLEVCELLLERSADGSLTDRAGATPLHYACSSSSERAGLLVALLLSHNHGAENMDVALQSAGLSGNMAALRALSCYEMHPEAVAAALQAAAGRGNLEVLQWLLDHGGAPESSPSPLMAAARGGHISCVIALLDFGAHGVDAGGRNALHWAVVGEQASICELLIQRGCRVDAADIQEVGRRCIGQRVAAVWPWPSCCVPVEPCCLCQTLLITGGQPWTKLRSGTRSSAGGCAHEAPWGHTRCAELRPSPFRICSCGHRTKQRNRGIHHSVSMAKHPAIWFIGPLFPVPQDSLGRRLALLRYSQFLKTTLDEGSFVFAVPRSLDEGSFSLFRVPQYFSRRRFIRIAATSCCFWRRSYRCHQLSAMRWRVTGAMAGTDEQAWGRALSHLQLLLTDMSPIPRWSPKEGNTPTFR